MTRRLILTAAVVAGALAIARLLPLRPELFSDQLAGTREITAYELGTGQTLSFALPPGTRQLRVLSNLDLAPGASSSLYALRVRDADDGRDETFPLLAQPAGGAAFFLGRADTPARTRLLALTRASSRPATLEISLLAPAEVKASLRLLVAHGRLASIAPRPQDLDPDARELLEAQIWSRLPTPQKSATRTFYLRGTPAPPPPRARDGEPVGGGRVAAFTVEGPGTLHLEAALGPLIGEAALMNAAGQVRREALDLSPGGRASLAIRAGLSTVRVTAEAPAQVRAVASRPQMSVEPVTGQGEVPIEPAWSWQSLVQADAGDAPVTFAVAERGQAALQVSARVPLGPFLGPASATTLRWTFVDERGGVLARGRMPVGAQVAPEDRLDGPAGPLFVSEPTPFFLWPPHGAHRLLFRADRPVLLSLSSPGFESAAAPGERHGLGPRVVLRHDSAERPAFYPVRPLDLAELRRTGRLARFAGARRLELLPESPPLAAPSALVPRGDGGRFEMVAPIAADAHAGRAGLLWSVRQGRDETVTLPRPPGASSRARVAATLLYETERPGRRTLTVSVDGQPVRRALALGTRGRVALPPLPVGHHLLRVELPAGGRVFIDQPVAGAVAYRRSRVFALRRGGALVALAKGGTPRSLGLVLYTEGPRPSRLEAVVDGGIRRARRGGTSRGYTRLRRQVALTFHREPGAAYLNRARREIWASAPVFVPLGDDLARGIHRIAIHTAGLGPQPLARFFSYGGPKVSRINQHVELRAESSE